MARRPRVRDLCFEMLRSACKRIRVLELTGGVVATQALCRPFPSKQEKLSSLFVDSPLVLGTNLLFYMCSASILPLDLTPALGSICLNTFQKSVR